MAALLETERPLSAEQIRTQIEGYGEAGATFRRSFERDKDDLREMGIPLSVEPIPGSDPPLDGYRIRKSEYFLPDPGLEPDELAALHLAASAVRIEGMSESAALRKLGGVVGESSGDAMVSIPADPNLAVCFRAMTEQRLLEFSYSNADRVVEPRRLNFQRGNWYLSGYDRSRDDTRHFRLDRIQGGVKAGDIDEFASVTEVKGVQLAGWELGDEPEKLARLLIDADQADWARHHVGEPAEVFPDGSVILEIPVSNEAAFRGLVLTFLEHAEILEPVELRDGLVSWLEEVAAS